MTADLDQLLGYKTKSVVIIDQASLGISDKVLKFVIFMYIVVIQMWYNKQFLLCKPPDGKATITQATFGAFEWVPGRGEAKILSAAACDKLGLPREHNSEYMYQVSHLIPRLVPQSGYSYCTAEPCEFKTAIDPAECDSSCFWQPSQGVGGALVDSGTDSGIVEWSVRVNAPSTCFMKSNTTSSAGKSYKPKKMGRRLQGGTKSKSTSKPSTTSTPSSSKAGNRSGSSTSGNASSSNKSGSSNSGNASSRNQSSSSKSGSTSSSSKSGSSSKSHTTENITYVDATYYAAGVEDMYLQIQIAQVSDHFLDSKMSEVQYGGIETTMGFELETPNGETISACDGYATIDYMSTDSCRKAFTKKCTWSEQDPLFIPLRALLQAAGILSLSENFGQHKSSMTKSGPGKIEDLGLGRFHSSCVSAYTENAGIRESNYKEICKIANADVDTQETGNANVTKTQIHTAYGDVLKFATYSAYLDHVNALCSQTTFRETSMVLFVSVTYNNWDFSLGSFSTPGKSNVKAKLHVAAFPSRMPVKTDAETTLETKGTTTWERNGVKVVFVHSGQICQTSFTNVCVTLATAVALLAVSVTLVDLVLTKSPWFPQYKAIIQHHAHVENESTEERTANELELGDLPDSSSVQDDK